MSSFFKGKRILVTGGTGSIGSEIVRQLLAQDAAVVRVFARDEFKQFMMQQEHGVLPNIRYLVGDVRDEKRLHMAMEDIDCVFHCAAYKHVPVCEYNSFEAVKTNVVGTQNVIDAAIAQGVERVLLVSTDKAASPSNVMGATKLLAEKLMTSAMHSVGKRTIKFSSVRFGNVIGSRGSVIPLFVDQAKKGGPVTITDPNMTRFFMSISQAVHLTFTAMEQMNGGEVFIFKMPAMKLGDLTDVIVNEVAAMTGVSPESITRKAIGARPGEKMEEILMTKEEAASATETDDMYVVHSILQLEGERDWEQPEATVSPHEYNSAEVEQLNQEQIKSLLSDYFAKES